MAKVVVSRELLDALAQHINAKAGATGAKTIAQMQAAVDALPVMTLAEYAQSGWPDSVLSDRGITSVREYAFCLDAQLQQVSMPNLTTIAEGAFQGCVNLTTFNFEKVATIDDYAFRNCPMLGSALELPAVKFGLTSGRYAFQYCTAITSVSAPVTNLIPHSCFMRCASLESISFPQAGTLNDWCFSYCSALKEATLPAVKTFTRYVFANSALEKLVLPGGTVAKIAADTFQNTPIASGTGYVYVPDDLLESYKAAAHWSSIADKLKPLSELA